MLATTPKPWQALAAPQPWWTLRIKPQKKLTTPQAPHK